MEDLLNEILARADQVPTKHYSAEELLKDIQELVIDAIQEWKDIVVYGYPPG